MNFSLINRLYFTLLVNGMSVRRQVFVWITLLVLLCSTWMVSGVEAANGSWGSRYAPQPASKCGDASITGNSEDLKDSSSGGGSVIYWNGDYRYVRLGQSGNTYTYRMDIKANVIGGPKDTNGQFEWFESGTVTCKTTLPLRCRNFEENWAQTFDVRRVGNGPPRYNTTNFSNTRIWVRACYNGSTIYIEGHEETFRLSSVAQNKGFRPLVAHHVTDLTPSGGTGPNNASSSSVRVRFRPHFALPRQPLSSLGIAGGGFGLNAGFQDNGAQVNFYEYAINIDPHGCYIYTGGGSQNQCPHGRYGGN